eukprot:1123895-Prorocentrum_minimum.AAC.1
MIGLSCCAQSADRCPGCPHLPCKKGEFSSGSGEFNYGSGEFNYGSGEFNYRSGEFASGRGGMVRSPPPSRYFGPPKSC